MRKEIAVIVSVDVKDLNQRLKEGYTVDRTVPLANGNQIFVLSKYTYKDQEGMATKSPNISGQLDVPTSSQNF